MKMNKKTIITLLLIGGVAYYIWDRQKKGKKLNPFSSFTGNEDASFYNATGDPTMGGGGTKRGTKMISLYTAGGYDSSHQNADGTRGATWIGYNNDRTQGYWVKGFVKSGTRM